VQLELARRLFDPDAEVRKRLARALPSMQSVDPAPWLLQLSRDHDPEVRLVAVGLIATTGDGALWQQIERAVQNDPDPRIRRQAQQIAERGRR
jgi:HEAT repeat protein